MQDNERKESWFSKIKLGLNKTSKNLGNQIASIFSRNKISEETIEELEEALIMADLGVKTSSYIIEELKKNKLGKENSLETIKESLLNIIKNILDPYTKPITLTSSPHVILICGVNGNGKTTTIGKLSHWFKQQNKKVLLAACDTFRAAASSQLERWAEKTNVNIVIGEENQDPASVAFNAFSKAKNENYDVLLIDTAGRLHNKNNLMEELSKIIRVIKKIDEKSPEDIILILDATTGQNAFNQVKIFNEITNLTGLIVTKLDGTAKGGVVVGLVKEFSLPIFAIGVGEGIDDLQPFTSTDFAKNLILNETE
ncbi:MAG: signal recognition particle-docking protein FtsY [Sphingobacteriia bacterium]|nr:signal recognition particle-docking protein FtsY [Sphingobacteriia bacterium]